MKILIIGFDHRILATNQDTPADTRERHTKYAAALAEQFPGGQIVVLVKSQKGSPNQKVVVSDNLTLYSVSSGRIEFSIKAYAFIVRHLADMNFDLITTQTPFDDGLVALCAGNKFRIPVNIQMRSSFLDMDLWIQERPFIYRLFNIIGKYTSAKAATIRVVSFGERRNDLKHFFQSLKEKIHCLQPYINMGIFGISAS